MNGKESTYKEKKMTLEFEELFMTLFVMMSMKIKLDFFMSVNIFVCIYFIIFWLVDFLRGFFVYWGYFERPINDVMQKRRFLDPYTIFVSKF